MTPQPHRRVQRTIAAHFSAGGSPLAEQEMRDHLRGCASCRDHYQRYLLIAEVDPAAPSAEARLARSLGIAPRPALRLPPLSWAFAAAGAVAVAAAAVLLIRVQQPPEQDQVAFVSRGAPRGSSPAPAPEIMVYRLSSGSAAAEPAGGLVSSGDELAFAYRNSLGKGWLLIFAVDEHGHVYWYHPGWSRAGEDPIAVPVSSAPGLHELPTAVAHVFDGEKLVIHALFTDRQITARQVEAAVAASTGAGGESGGAATFAARVGQAEDRTGGVLRLPGAVDVRRPFRVVAKVTP